MPNVCTVVSCCIAYVTPAPEKAISDFFTSLTGSGTVCKNRVRACVYVVVVVVVCVCVCVFERLRR